MKRIHLMIAAIVLVPCWGQAQEPGAAGASFKVLDAKICSGVQDKEAVDEKTTFNTGEKAWLWMKVRPAGETTMQIRWSLDGKTVYAMDPVPARLGRLWYYKTLHKPGEWQVDVLDASQKVVHSEKFTAVGEAGEKTAVAPPSRTAATGTAATTEESDHVEVVELKLAEGVENRDPVRAGTSFAKGGRVYTWMRLKVKDPETTIKLRWSLNDKVVSTSEPVTVKESPAWRTWLYKTMYNSGDWKVEVLDAEDKPVYAENFTVN